MNGSRLLKYYKAFTKLLKDAAREAFPIHPLRLIDKEYNHLTKQTIFILKNKRMPTPIKLTARQLLESDQYLVSLSKKYREIVEAQYLFELKQPKATIEEFPIHPNAYNQLIFKIYLMDEGRIVCGTAKEFIKHNDRVCSMLSKKDLVALSMAYYESSFEGYHKPAAVPSSKQNNVYRLK